MEDNIAIPEQNQHIFAELHSVILLYNDTLHQKTVQIYYFNINHIIILSQIFYVFHKFVIDLDQRFTTT